MKMTKAFTSALGYGVTVRGYIDEDDRLVLLEPEGGGGGDYTEATLTVVVPLGAQAPLISAPLIDEENGMIIGTNGTVYTSGTYKLAMYKGAGVLSVDGDITISGNAEELGRDEIKYSGDFTITVESA